MPILGAVNYFLTLINQNHPDRVLKSTIFYSLHVPRWVGTGPGQARNGSGTESESWNSEKPRPALTERGSLLSYPVISTERPEGCTDDRT